MGRKMLLASPLHNPALSWDQALLDLNLTPLSSACLPHLSTAVNKLRPATPSPRSLGALEVEMATFRGQSRLGLQIN